MKIPLLLCITFFALSVMVTAQPNPTFGGNKHKYILTLNDAQLDVGLKTVTVFALDDRASLYANPHFQAMWNLINLGATLEAMLQGKEPINDLNLGKKYGQNGYNKTVLMFFLRYGFGESSDVALQRHFFELGISPGFYKQGKGGTHLQLEYQMNLLKTAYGAGGASIEKMFDHEVYVGARMGFDGSFSRSESETGFFSTLINELERIANENEFTAAQLIKLEDMAEQSRILLPKDVGGRSFHIGPVIGGRLSKHILHNAQVFLNGTAFYDLMDLTNGKNNQENERSQHQINISLGFNITIGGEGKSMVKGFF